MSARTYEPVTPAQVESFLQQARTAGLTVNPESATAGSVSGYGSEVQYSYLGDQQQVVLDLTRHVPFLEGATWDQIEERLPAGIRRVA